MLHRDVKPANVLFRTVDPEHEGTLVRAMVGDLGLGKALDVSSRLTMIAGTPSYVAPEQAQGEHLDARADQYSLAALAYLLLTGRPPYAHSTLSGSRRPRAAGADVDATSDPSRPPSRTPYVAGSRADRDERWPDVPAFVDRAADRPRRDRRRASCPRAGCPSTPSSPSRATGPHSSRRPTTCLIRCHRGAVVAGRPPRWPSCCSRWAPRAGSSLWRGNHTEVTHTDDDGLPLGDRAACLGPRGLAQGLEPAGHHRWSRPPCRSATGPTG